MSPGFALDQTRWRDDLQFDIIEHMSDTCSCPYCGRPATGDDVDHTEAPPDDPVTREDNLTPVSRRREVMLSR